MTAAKTIQGDAIGRRFEFARDTFAFANELVWTYQFDPATGKTTVRRRKPKPGYTHRCFVLTRAVRQFRYHARFDAGQPVADDEICRHLIREVISRNPRTPCPPDEQIVIPGHDCLRDFSRAHEPLFKIECGGAWRSYFLRSHWRMVFPISRAHQTRTATELFAAVKQNISPIIHLVNFPSLSINHGMVVFGGEETARGFEFQAYDPNDPKRPSQLTFDRQAQTFFLPANPYWAGGSLNLIEIYRRWFL
jgi:hypothetical protein